MLRNRPINAGGQGLFYALLVGIVLMIPNFSLANDAVGTQAIQGSADNVPDHGMQIPKGHRIITGTVEEVNANTVRVSAGEAGEISPRYLNLDNVKGDVELRPGDILQIELNAQNKVLKYQKVKGRTKN
ncbi:MAG: hypothetical protein ABIP82_03810 [Nitrospirales bacterium]